MDVIDIVLLILLLIVCYLYFRDRHAIKCLAKDLESRLSSSSTVEIPVESPNTSYRTIVELLNKLLYTVRQQMSSIEEGNQEMQHTLSSLSHDLRTPLTPAKGYIELVMKGEIGEKEREMLDISRKRLEVLNDLLEDLFRFTKLRDKRFELSPKRINLVEAVQEIFFAFYEEFRLKNIELSFDLPEEEILIFQDPEAIEQILSNVIQNALRYGKEKLFISIKKDPHLEMSFSNPTEQQITDVNALKNSYVRAEGNRPEGSTGLGLAIIDSYLERMGGKSELSFQNGIFTIKILL
ncbi:sensor histidine kinase [Guggenheimella bovis]